MNASEQLAGSEVTDQASVCGEEVVTGQIAKLAPAQVVEDVVGDFAFELVNGKELQIDGAAVAVSMPDVRHQCSDAGADA